MKKRSKGITLLALCFFLLGIMWTVMISKRCGKLAPNPGPRPKVTSVASIKNDIQKSIHTVTQQRYIYAKPYHIALFWGIIFMELVCATYYILSGISLFRLYPIARVMAMGTLCLDLVFKLFVTSYMRFCAIPLQQLTDKSNLLYAYYMPDESLMSQISSYLTGLRIFQPGMILYLCLYLSCLAGCFYFFTRMSVKAQFKRV